MPTKEERKLEAEKHNGLMNGVFAKETKQGIEAAVLYEDGAGRELDIPAARFEQTAVEVTPMGVERAVLRASGNACVVDPASYRYPGSGYVNGAWTPEAALCACSNLYQILEGTAPVFYEQNRNDVRGELYSDRALFLPEVTFTEGGMKKRSVVVCAPPDRKRALEHHRSEAEIAGDLANRIETVMRIAAVHEVDSLVIPAFGCGAQGNDPAQVAQLFKAWLDAHPGCFKTVTFAIGRPFIEAFDAVFAPPSEPEPVVVPDIAEEDEEDDEDWRNYMSV